MKHWKGIDCKTVGFFLKISFCGANFRARASHGEREKNEQIYTRRTVNVSIVSTQSQFEGGDYFIIPLKRDDYSRDANRIFKTVKFFLNWIFVFILFIIYFVTLDLRHGNLALDMEPSTIDERRMTVVLLKDTTAIRLEIRLISVSLGKRLQFLLTKGSFPSSIRTFFVSFSNNSICIYVLILVAFLQCWKNNNVFSREGRIFRRELFLAWKCISCACRDMSENTNDFKFLVLFDLTKSDEI